MKQAIQEGFILDVLASYTTVDRYFNLVKSIEDDPEFDSRRAQRKLRRYVEGHEYAVHTKAEIMVDHFHESVFLPEKIQGPSPRHGRHRRSRPAPSATTAPSAPTYSSKGTPTGRSSLSLETGAPTASE